jgi:C1A family cysteine protease
MLCYLEKFGLKTIDRVAMNIRVGAITSPDNIKVGAAPSSLDYNALGKVTSIKNQGSCGCCWSFASTAMYESQLLFQNKGNFGLSEEASLQCTSFYADGGRVSDCSGGYFPDPLTFLARVGSLLRSDYPYISGNHGDSAGYSYTLNICNDTNRIMVGDGIIQLYSGANPAQIKNLLFT